MSSSQQHLFNHIYSFTCILSHTSHHIHSTICILPYPFYHIYHKPDNQPHPRGHPMEYWKQHLSDTKDALRRAYRVELFLLSKRYEYGIIALHKERRQQLNLTNLPSSQDFPEATLTSPTDKSRVLGKLCLFHPHTFTKNTGQSLRYRSRNLFFWLTFYLDES